MQTFIFLLLIVIMASCVPFRAILSEKPDIGNQDIFPQYFLPASEKPYILPTNLASQDNERDLNQFLRKHKTFAFVVIRRDTITTEYYLTPELKYKAINVFSLSKSFVATTLCIALQEGYIKNLKDTLGNYLTELPADYKKIRIIDLLNMRSGIKTTFLNTTRLYYSYHLNKTNQSTPILSPSGANYKYSNQVTQLLVTLIEKTTGKKFEEFFFEKVWCPLQMENNGYWSLDSRKYHTVRGFAGLSLTARDAAKLGLLYLHNGNLNHQQIIPASWVQNTISPDEDARITPEQYYHMHWKIITPGEEFLAKGLFGQYLYVNKKTNTVIVRIGLKNTKTNWIAFFRQQL